MKQSIKGMKKLIIISFLGFALGINAFANGGVSDGGGGTTNPNPANPKWIAVTVQNYAGRVILPWLNSREEEFNRLSKKEQSLSPFLKLFKPNKDIYQKDIFDIVKAASIELRMSEPCFDKNNQPWDGSIYGTEPGSICISPFSMALKLTELNYEEETIALIMHELSHLMGATEDEARLIQKQAVYDFSKLDIRDMTVKQSLIIDSSGMEMGLINLEAMFDSPEETNASRVQYTHDSIVIMLSKIHYNFLTVSFARENTRKFFDLLSLRLRLMLAGAAALDPVVSDVTKKSAIQNIEKAFQGNSSALVKEIKYRLNGTDPATVNPLYANEVILNPSSPENFAVEAKVSYNHLKMIRDEVRALIKLNFYVYRKW